MPVKTKHEDSELKNNTSSSDNSQEIEGIDLDYSNSIVNGYRSNYDSHYNRFIAVNPNTVYAPAPPTNPFATESQDYQYSNYSAFYPADHDFNYVQSQQSTAQTTHTITTTNTVIQPVTAITVSDTTKGNNNSHLEYRALTCLISSSILGILLLFLCPCLSCLPFMSMRKFGGYRNKRIKAYVYIGNTLSCILGTAGFILFICIYLPAIVVILAGIVFSATDHKTGYGNK